MHSVNNVRRLSHTRKPAYEHDGCKTCHFVGAYKDDNGKLDAWICLPSKDTSSTGSLIVRNGDEGSQYWSMPIFILVDILKNPTQHPYTFTSSEGLIALETYGKLEDLKKKIFNEQTKK